MYRYCTGFNYYFRHHSFFPFLFSARPQLTKTRMPKNLELIDAANFGNVSDVCFYLANKADVNQSSVDGYTPLQKAIFHGHNQIAELLIESKADLNHKCFDFGDTALHIAAAHGRSVMARRLLVSDGLIVLM